MRFAGFILCLLLSTPVFANKVWECTDSKGRLEYRDQPCPDNPSAPPVHGNAEVKAADAQQPATNAINAPSVAPEPVDMTAPADSSAVMTIDKPKPNKALTFFITKISSTFSYVLGAALVFGVIASFVMRKGGHRRADPVFYPYAALETIAGETQQSSARFVSKRFLSPHEKQMFRLLVSALPQDWFVLAQVSMGQLVDAIGGDPGQNHALRNRVAQKTCDFVICDEGLNVRLVIELDDRTHEGKGVQDHQRDSFLLQAGIETKRFVHVPPADYLKEVLSTCLPASGQQKAA